MLLTYQNSKFGVFDCNFSYVIAGVSGFFGGSLVELYGCRIVAMTGSLIAALGYAISAFVSSIQVLYFTYSFLTGE